MTVHTNHTFIEIDVKQHKETGMMIATSKQVRGLFVHGDTMEELNDRIPEAIVALMEAKGHKNVIVRPAEEVSLESIGFETQTRRFELQEAA
ncbi:DUF1902 domain-containing protein [Rhizobium oryzihabitans]|uniref:DUF1902 domain-containing protein n=1 Tax=Rhizobium oryzihabitans TaxID=2267833 RepID=A0A7L5BDH2_9HYPH|nr:DUF1902 domain-containing protein [Rhizobium oryzihabitans]QIB36928.1 DUF1902 domain-containing protein [Rhizobium oryzihabitans]